MLLQLGSDLDLIWVYLVSPILFIAGAISLWNGISGRRVTKTQVCIVCEYDLRGANPASTKCPECGSDITLPGATTLEARKHMPAWFASGVLLCALGVWVRWFAVSGRFDNFKVSDLKPISWIRNNAHSSDELTRRNAFIELFNRVNSQNLTNSELNSVMDDALSAQADLSTPWNADWGGLIEIARSTGKLSDEKWKQYLRQRDIFHVVIRPIVGRGDDIPIQVYSETRDQKPSSFYETVSLRTEGFYIIGHDFEELHNYQSPNKFNSQLPIDPTQLADLPDDTYTLKLSIKYEVIERKAPSGIHGINEIETQGTFKLVSGDSVTPFDDESLRSAVEHSLFADEPDLAATSFDPKRLRLSMFYLNNQLLPSIGRCISPADLSYKVSVSTGRRLYPFDSIVGKKGDALENPFPDIQIPSGISPVSKVDIIFQPDADMARKTVDILRYWNGKVVIHGLPVSAATPAIRPAVR